MAEKALLVKEGPVSDLHLEADVSGEQKSTCKGSWAEGVWWAHMDRTCAAGTFLCWRGTQEYFAGHGKFRLILYAMKRKPMKGTKQRSDVIS